MKINFIPKTKINNLLNLFGAMAELTHLNLIVVENTFS